MVFMADVNLDGAVSCYFPSPLNEPPINQRAQLRPTRSVEKNAPRTLIRRTSTGHFSLPPPH